jgi:hypothetical protein
MRWADIHPDFNDLLSKICQPACPLPQLAEQRICATGSAWKSLEKSLFFRVQYNKYGNLESPDLAAKPTLQIDV